MKEMIKEHRRQTYGSDRGRQGDGMPRNMTDLISKCMELRIGAFLAHGPVHLGLQVGGLSLRRPLHVVVRRWGREPAARGAYSSVARGGSGEDYDAFAAAKPV